MFDKVKSLLFDPVMDFQQFVRLKKLIKSASLGAFAVTTVAGVAELVFIPQSFLYMIITVIVGVIFAVTYLFAWKRKARAAGLFLTISL